MRKFDYADSPASFVINCKQFISFLLFFFYPKSIKSEKDLPNEMQWSVYK